MMYKLIKTETTTLSLLFLNRQITERIQLCTAGPAPERGRERAVASCPGWALLGKML